MVKALDALLLSSSVKNGSAPDSSEANDKESANRSTGAGPGGGSFKKLKDMMMPQTIQRTSAVVRRGLLLRETKVGKKKNECDVWT